MSKASPKASQGAAPQASTLLEEAEALRQRGNVAAARTLARAVVAQNGPQSAAGARLLALTGFPMQVLVYAAAAAAILLALVTLATLRS